MNKSTRHASDKDATLANVALLYYGEGLTQSDIAKRMQVSRATIVNMLRESRERGIVEIRVDGHHLSSSNLAREIRDRFGLQDVYIAISDTSDMESERSDLLGQVGRVGASAILDIIEPGDRLGVAWGETIMAVSNVTAQSSTDQVEVCQLIGSEMGAVGIICCRYIDRDGKNIETSPDERLLAATLSNLRKPKKKLLVVCGSDRAHATLAAIRGDLVTHLCVDQGLAKELLAL